MTRQEAAQRIDSGNFTVVHISSERITVNPDSRVKFGGRRVITKKTRIGSDKSNPHFSRTFKNGGRGRFAR